jgi:hypothetical protein
MVALLAGLEKKYSEKKPVYIVLGDFNVYLRRSDLSEGWDIYPKERKSARNLRPQYPVDYILVRGSIHVETEHAREFSPLPLKIEKTEDGTSCYSLSNRANILADDRKPIVPEDLEHIRSKNHSNLLGNNFAI